jgi:hypothetical protein
MAVEQKVRRRIDLEKFLIYILITATLLTTIIYLADMKERIRALEVEVFNLKKGE